MRVAATIQACAMAGVLLWGPALQAGSESEHSMTGCLKSGDEAGTYRLTELGLEDGPEAVHIAEASVDLEPHVGHKVELTGSTVSGADPAAHTMKITGMKHLAATCP